MSEAPVTSSQTPSEPTPSTSTTPPPAPASTDPGLTPQPAALTDPAPTPAEPKPGEDPKPTEPAPPLDLSTLTVPEGFVLDDKAKATIAPIFQELNLSSEGAQKLLNLHADLTKQIGQQIQDNWTQLNDKWVSEVKADPEIGGPKLEASLAAVAKLIDRAPDPKALREALNITGAGNNPAVIKALASWANALNEPNLVTGTPPSTQGSRPDPASALYPNLA